MTDQARRRALRTLGLATAGLAVASGADAREAALTAPGAASLDALMKRLAAAPRRRAFKTVPVILDDPAQWDHEALAELKAYKARPRQVWNVTEIGGSWPNTIRNALNGQIWSFKHPDFLVVAALHGSAGLALYDQATWEKYQLTKLAGDKFKTNTLIAEKPIPAVGPKAYEDPKGPFSSADNSIPTLMRRGVVFAACHNAIWEQASKLIEKDINPDKLAVDALAAELTNHLIEGAVLTPGVVATIPELQDAGFHYIQ